MSATDERRSRTGAVGCSPTPIPRWMTWGCVLTFVAAIAATVVGAIVPSSTILWVVTMVFIVVACVAVIAVGARAALPELFRRNR